MPNYDESTIELFRLSAGTGTPIYNKVDPQKIKVDPEIQKAIEEMMEGKEVFLQ